MSMRSYWFDGLSTLRLRYVLLLALVLRAAWFALCPNEPVSDQGVYHRAGSALAVGLGYIEQGGEPANLWPVGYPALLAAVYWLFGAHYSVAYALNIAISLLLVAGVAQLGSLLFGRPVGVIAALLVAAHPTFVMHTTMLSSELPFATGAVWLLALFVRIARAEVSLRWSVPLAGVGLGLLTYVRPTAQTFVVVLPALGLFWGRLRWSSLALASLGVLACALLVLLPWGFRNERAFGVFALTSMNAGENIWMGNNPDSQGVYMELPSDALALPFVPRQRLLAARAMAFIREHPGKYLALCAQRVGQTMRSDTIGAAWNDVGITKRFGSQAIVFFKVLCSVVHWALLAAVAFALLLRIRSHWRREDTSLALMLLLLSVPFVLIVGGNRYMVPILPLLCIWAASGIWQTVSSAGRSATAS